MVCRARGARQPLFRRSQFHAGAALTARKALDASALARAARTSGRTVAATNKCLAQSNKPRTRGKATKKRESRLLRRCDPSSENETKEKKSSREARFRLRPDKHKKTSIMKFVSSDIYSEDYRKRRSAFLKELIASTSNVSVRAKEFRRWIDENSNCSDNEKV